MSSASARQAYTTNFQQAALESINRNLDPYAPPPSRRTRLVKDDRSYLQAATANSSSQLRSSRTDVTKNLEAECAQSVASTEQPFHDAHSQFGSIIETSGKLAGRKRDVPARYKPSARNESKTVASGVAVESGSEEDTYSLPSTTQPQEFAPTSLFILPHLRERTKNDITAARKKYDENHKFAKEHRVPKETRIAEVDRTAHRAGTPDARNEPRTSPSIPPHLKKYTPLVSATSDNEARFLAVKTAQFILGRSNPRQHTRIHHHVPSSSVGSSSTSESEYTQTSTDYSSTPVKTSAKPKAMNTGTAAKSAAKDSAFPCPYVDCGKGFTDRHDLKKHKYRDHEHYCKRCDFDGQDKESLIEHKMHSEKHIACEVCGADFNSEGGRNRHRLKDHKGEHNVRCTYCKLPFTGGAQLIKHHLLNECEHPDGGEARLRSFRALSALCYDKLDFDHEQALEAGVGKDYEPGSDMSSVVGTNTGASLLDADNDECSSIIASDETSSEAGSDLMTFDDDVEEDIKEPWSKKFFKDGKNTTSTASDSGSTAGSDDSRVSKFIDRRKFYEEKIKGPNARHMATDWACVPETAWERNLTNHVICPFASCNKQFESIQATIEHVSDGSHMGTDLACPKCHKRFDIDKRELRLARFHGRYGTHGNSGYKIMPILDETAPSFKKVPGVVRLLSHMETSEKCDVKSSTKYGHYIHILSGGFLRLMKDEFDRPYLVEAETPDPTPAAVLYDHPGGSEW